MFVAVQFPLADLRRFLPIPTGRLTAPPWPLADPARHFVRSVGPVRERRRGGAPEWLGENLYCEARELVKIRSEPGERLHGPAGGVPVRGVHRRFFAGGHPLWAGAVARAEAAFVTTGHRGYLEQDLPVAAGSRRRAAAARESVALSCLTLPALVPGVSTAPRELRTLGPDVARRILTVTTARSRPDPPQPWWVTAGRPLVLLESDTAARDAGRFFSPEQSPFGAGDPDPGWLAGHDLVVLERGGDRIPVWSLLTNRRADRDAGRRLRIHLWRLHTEREVLRIVLARVIEGGLDPSFPPLRDYLARQSERLHRTRRDGFPQRSLLDLAYDVDALVNADRIDELREILTAVGPGVSAAVLALAARGSTGTGNVYINYVERGTVNTTGDGGQHISGGQIGAVVSGTVSGGAFQGSGLQQVAQGLSDTDFARLPAELGLLRTALREQAVEPHHDLEVAAVAEAQIAAESGDREKTVSSLRKAGKWALDTATTIGTTVAAAVIKSSLGA